MNTLKESKPIKKIAALTMVRNDYDFLKHWVAYYGRELGLENLYIYFDGEDQKVPDYCKGVNITVRPQMVGDIVTTDRERAKYISEEACKLMNDKNYEIALGTDVDEFLIADPKCGKSLAEYLSDLPSRATWSGLGVDVGQLLAVDAPLDWDKKLLAQRSVGWLYTRYTKATVITRPLIWGSGFHRVKGHNYNIAPNLFLFHFGGIDLERIRKRCSMADIMGKGWKRHLNKRIRTIMEISKVTPRRWYPTVKLVRWMQQICRPIFAWNKPTTYGLKFVVEIPERFKKIV